jgi:hypothetical protein
MSDDAGKRHGDKERETRSSFKTWGEALPSQMLIHHGSAGASHSRWQILNLLLEDVRGKGSPCLEILK